MLPAFNQHCCNVANFQPTLAVLVLPAISQLHQNIDEYLITLLYIFQIVQECRNFLEKYGSHVSTGTVHFGGTYEWKSEYNGETSGDSHSYKNEVSNALAVSE